MKYRKTPICCICLKKTTDKNLVLVSRKAPIPGTGWGCHTCGLPADGAVSILCDECFSKFANKKVPVKYVYRGFLDAGELVELKTLDNFNHDEIKHAMAEKKECGVLH